MALRLLTSARIRGGFALHMATDRVNHNRVLIVMAAVAPFEVFLLSFAVLGPLH
jgi:hypothetical protein